MILGDFGTVHEPIDDTFGWFGTAVRVNPDWTDTLFTDWAEQFSNVDDEDATKALSASKVLMRNLIHAEDFDGFWAAVLRNRQTSADLAGLMNKVTEALADRPTQQPSDSSAGRGRTVAKLRGVSSSAARLEEAGRADLALVHIRAAEARAV